MSGLNDVQTTLKAVHASVILSLCVIAFRVVVVFVNQGKEEPESFFTACTISIK